MLNTPTITPIEPVSPELFKSYARLSTTEEDVLVGLFIAAAREKAETYCNRPFISKVLTQTFTIDQVCPIPAADILGVTGFYSSVEQVQDAYQYFNNYLKGIVVNRDYPLDYDNLPTYSVTYQIDIDPATVPDSVKVAIAKIAADLYENREHSSSNSNKEISINYKTLLAPYRILF